MYPNKKSRFREGRHAEVQAGEGDLDQMEDDMRNLGAYRMSGSAKSLIEPDRTPRKMYGDFPAIPETPRDYAKRPEKPTTKKYVASSPRQNRAIGLGQGRKSERPLTRLEKEQEFAAVKLQSMARGRAQRSQLLQEKALEQQMANQDNDNDDDNDDIQKNRPSLRPSLRDRRRSKSRERAQSRGSTGSLPRVSQPESFEMENDQQNNVRGRSQSDLQPRSPTSDSRQRRSPSPRKARATQGNYNTKKGRGSPASVASEYTDRGLHIDFDAVEQLRLKLKQACTTHKGCEPSKMFDRWDRDKDGELDRDEVHDGLKKLLGKDVLREWNMFENFFSYIDTDGNNSIDRDEFAEFVTTKPEVQVIRRKSQQYDSPKQVFENFHGTFQGDKHRGGQKAFGAHGDTDMRPKSYYKERTGIDSSPMQLKTKGSGSNSPTTSIDISEIDFDAVEQLRLKLKISCTTHKGCEPSKIFDKWDKDKDGELDRDEVLDGMNKLLGKDVLSEWNMFENFFSYIDTDGNNSIDRDEFAEFVTAKPEVQVIRRKSQQYDSPKQVFENFHGTFQGDKHRGGQKAFGAHGDTDMRPKSYYKERTGIDSSPMQLKTKGSGSNSPTTSIDISEIDFDAVEQLRLKLKISCTTHKGCEPSKIFDKWDKDKDGELDRDEVLDGMNKLLGKDVLSEWNMFENFFSYIDTDGNNSIDRDEFAEFVTAKPEVQVIRRKSQQYDSPKQVFENFHGTFQGDKHRGGQKAFGSYGDTDKKQKSYYIERTGLEPAEIKAKKKQLDKSLNADDIDFDAVEQLRLKLKQACNTHKGLEPSKIFDKWDKDKDGELDREEVLEGMNKLLGKDVLEEWNMFENFFAYIDSDGNNSIDRDEFAEFVTFQPEVKVVRRKTEIAESPKQVFESFHGTFQGDKHKGGQKQFGRVGGDAWEFKKTYGGEYDD